jgi:hypothetical protein
VSDHPHIPAQIPAQPLALSDLKLTKTLHALLFGKTPADVAVAEIRQDRALHIEVRRVANDLRKLAGPCGEEFVGVEMKKLILVYGAGESPRAASWWKLYYQALRDVPREALEQAVQDYVSSPDSLFFPKPGQLKALAMKRAEPIYQAASRAKRAADGEVVRSKAPMSDAQTDALARAQELERQVPPSIRTKLPMSQWPEEYRAKIEEADRLREGVR